jgi:Mrp family chromosome partitioning ATPase/capsular polysaccharide biosynthesis protein
MGLPGGSRLDTDWAGAAEERASGQSPTLGEYARAIWRRRLLIAAGLILGLVLGTVVLPATVANEGTWQATVRLKVSELVSDTIVRERPQFDSDSAEVDGNALQDVVLADEVLGQLGQEAAGLTAPDVVGRLTASPVPGSSYVDLAYTDTDVDRAATIAQAYAKAWARRRNAVDVKRLKTAMAGVESQVAELRQRVAELGSAPVGSEQTELRNAQSRLTTLVALRDEILKQRLFLGSPTAVLGTPVTSQLSAPTSPVLLLVLGLLIGLLAGAGLALVAEAIQPKVLTPIDVEHATGLPVIAGVPPGGMRGGLPVLQRPSSPAAEGFRRAAAALERRGLGDDVRILAVVSADRREGRTTLAANLAQLLARQGRDVLLVSADLRHPRLDELMGVGGESGLAGWLEDARDGVELPLRLVTDHLLVLPAGTTQRSPSELLTARRLRQGLEPLSQTGFTVVIDTPPALWPAEAMTLGMVADATVLVARAGTSRWRAIERLAEMLRRDGLHAVGVVLLGDRGKASSLAMRSGFGYTGRHQAGARREDGAPARRGAQHGGRGQGRAGTEIPTPPRVSAP